MRRIISGYPNTPTSSEKLHFSGVGERQSRRMETLTRLRERDKKREIYLQTSFFARQEFYRAREDQILHLSHLYLLIYHTRQNLAAFSRCKREFLNFYD